MKILGAFPGRKISQIDRLCKVIQRWWKSLLASKMACILFSSKWNCIIHWEMHALIWTSESFYCCTKLLSISTWPWETHPQSLDKSFLRDIFFNSEMWSCEHRQLKLKWMVHHLQSWTFLLHPRQSLICNVKQGTWHLSTNAILLMLVVSLSHPTVCKMGMGHKVTWNQSDPCSLFRLHLLSWIRPLDFQPEGHRLSM